MSNTKTPNVDKEMLMKIRVESRFSLQGKMFSIMSHLNLGQGILFLMQPTGSYRVL